MAFIQRLKQFTLIFFFSWVMVHYFLNEPQLTKRFGELMIEEDNQANKREQQARQYFELNQFKAKTYVDAQENVDKETKDHVEHLQETVGGNNIIAVEENHNIEQQQQKPSEVNESHEQTHQHQESIQKPTEQHIENIAHQQATETKPAKQTQAKKQASTQQQKQQPKKQSHHQQQQKQQKQPQTGTKTPTKKVQSTKKKGQAPLEDQ